MRVSVIERHDNDPLVIMWPDEYSQDDIAEYIKAWHIAGNALDDDWDMDYNWYVRDSIFAMAPDAAFRLMVNVTTCQDDR